MPTYFSQETQRPSQRPDIVLLNAKVLTLEPGHPRAEAVAVRGESVIAIGGNSDIACLAGPATQTIDGQGMCLLPGFIDAHCHLFAAASSLQALRCGPEEISNIRDLQVAIQNRAASTPQGKWIRGFGYDELALEERRHPTRWELDLAAPNHPVRIDHRSGHATVLNSRGLQTARIHLDTPDPVDGVIERKEDSREPTGLLLEMSAFLRQRLGQMRDEKDTKDGIIRLNRLLLSYGITSAHDAGANNDLARWHAFSSLQSVGHIGFRVTMMTGSIHLGTFLERGLRWGYGDHWLRLGHTKSMLSLTTGAMFPDIEELGRIVRNAHQSGFPVAIHAVEQEAVAAAVQVFQTIQSGRLLEKEYHPSSGSLANNPGKLSHRNAPNNLMPRDRIEHCAECPSKLAAQVGHSGAMVVTQPGFIYWNGDRYRHDVDPVLLNSLYPVGSLDRNGVSLAFGSDCPVIDPNPWHGIYSAVTGFSRDAHPLSEISDDLSLRDQKVPIEAALRMYTIAGAYADGTHDVKGTVRPGKLADLVLVDQDPTKVDPETLRDIRPILTMVGGRVAWEGG